MSLILDALRKSEAERRRGESPGLFSSTSIAPATRSDRPRVWPLLLLGAMLLLSAWLIWSAGTPGEDAPTAVVAQAAPEAVGHDAAADPEPGPRPATQPSPVRAAPAPPPLPVAKPGPAPDPKPVAASPSPTPAAVAPLPAPPMPLPAPQPAPAEPAPEALPPLAVLDAGTRASLPPLKLSMHVYSDDPSRRFAIVDGQRIAEGARLGAGVVVQIRRDGVVIEVDGRRVLLARP